MYSVIYKYMAFSLLIYLKVYQYLGMLTISGLYVLLSILVFINSYADFQLSLFAILLGQSFRIAGKFIALCHSFIVSKYFIARKYIYHVGSPGKAFSESILSRLYEPNCVCRLSNICHVRCQNIKIILQTDISVGGSLQLTSTQNVTTSMTVVKIFLSWVR